MVPNTLKGELVSALQVEKPILRWFPLVKYGETVQRYAYRNVHDNEPLYEHRVTTRTTVLALGFCSTARYDELARQPFEAFRAQLGHWVAARGH
ncbi:MAG TPA: hypothetical protein VHD61_07375 [Lacunisphaera sp.]|nr:hypothetical protein [Lacunisphaera sp.]